MITLIRGARVFDGERFVEGKSVLINEEGRLQLVEGDEGVAAAEVVEAEGFVLSPGFIDVHTHADYEIGFTDSANFLSQGVTLIIGGNCGISAGADNKNLEVVISPEGKFERAWKSSESYWQWLQSQSLGVNYTSLVGHQSLVEESLSLGIAMEELLDKLLSLGYVGVSYGFVYGHDREVVETSQVVEVAKRLAVQKKALTAHLKDQGMKMFEAVKMLTDLYAEPSCAQLVLQISHLKYMPYGGGATEDILRKVIELIEATQRQGYQVMADAYPYTAGSTSLGLPDREKQCKNGWADVYPMGSLKSIGQMADEQKIEPKQMVAQLLEKQPRSLAVYQNTCNEEDVWMVMQKPYCMVASDALPSHPRYSGTFPRVLRWALDHGRDLEKWLTKCTSLPSKQFRLGHNGFLIAGEKANLVLFDPKTIGDRSSYEQPLVPSQGIKKVWVNGKLAYTEKEGVTGRWGRVLSF